MTFVPGNRRTFEPSRKLFTVKAVFVFRRTQPRPVRYDVDSRS